MPKMAIRDRGWTLGAICGPFGSIWGTNGANDVRRDLYGKMVSNSGPLRTNRGPKGDFRGPKGTSGGPNCTSRGLYEAKEGFVANRGPWAVPIEDKEDHSLTFGSIGGQIGAICGRNWGQWGP